jgi:hypothetical protein
MEDIVQKISNKIEKEFNGLSSDKKYIFMTE